jgi:transposase
MLQYNIFSYKFNKGGFMPFQKTKPHLILSDESQTMLKDLIKSRTQSVQRVERAKILLSYHQTCNVRQTASVLHTNRMVVNRCVNKALEFGVDRALNDLQRSGKKPTITQDAIAWLISIACRKPKDVGHPYELWTTKLLANHARKHCVENGHPCLKNLAKGTVSKILNKQEIKPHKIKYYLERRDPAFDSKFIQVLYFYKSVNFLLDTGLAELADTTFISFDEKPGIQAIGHLAAPDLEPRPGKHKTIGRDYEYKRHGTVSLMAGIDLLTGHVHERIVDRHYSSEFIEFLKSLDSHYPAEKSIRVILDNHKIHTSAETREYLKTIPNRFEFVFTPKHGSWLNLIETFFSKIARTVLREIRVNSKEELKNRLKQFIAQINESPVVFRWNYGMDLV